MKKKTKKKEKNDEKEYNQIENPQLNVISKIMELKLMAEDRLLNSKFDEAIRYSEKIIRLAIENDMEHHIEEQQKFMEKVAENVQEIYFTSEIKDAGAKISKIYDVLLDSNKVDQAHAILESFKNHYKDKYDLHSIPSIDDLLTKDLREWIKYKISIQEKNKNVNNNL
ncbi:MAG: hypothetical protein ACFE85_17915 [Candidatus Hodarchaeota archaeon]